MALEETFIPEDYTNNNSQLVQARVPLEEAQHAFNSYDANGRVPIVIIPARLNRIQNQLVGLGLALLLVGIFGGAIAPTLALPLTAIGLIGGLTLLILGVYRAFIVRIPEGVMALLSRGGRYIKTVSSGTHILAPWVVVSHLVTRREIPFDVPAVALPTSDDVRATVDFIITFRINQPYEFVYNISADDFDHVLLAICQERLRAVVREITSLEVTDLVRRDFQDLRERLDQDVAPYGVQVQRVAVTFAQPPEDFLASQEARQLASLRREEQEQRQSLALRTLEDNEDLALRRLRAEVARDKESLQILIQKAAIQKEIVALEAQAEELRLQKLEERFKAYPLAAQFELERLRLEVAQALAGNSRAFLQVGQADDIPTAFVARDLLNYERLRTLINPDLEPEPDAKADSPA
ncbi:MAG: hypothetical protein KDD89_10380 [Anaerolineales bacterium]|nr:hypothetical protein [Anaerolineales bacterium]